MQPMRAGEKLVFGELIVGVLIVAVLIVVVQSKQTRTTKRLMKDQTATEQIWEELGMKIKSFIQKRVNDEQLAEDLVQETFVRIHKKLDNLDEMQRITSWVFQIARNLIIDHYRAKARDASAIADDIEASANEEENINELVIGWLPAMIAQLPDSYREAVELYELKETPQQEIADKLGISLSGAKSRVQRGRAKLKELLFDCCSFEMDRRGNLISYRQNKDCENCGDDCNC